MRTVILLLVAAANAMAQETVAPTPEASGSAEGETAVGYNFAGSMETGYRFVRVGGSAAMYRSSVNFGDGLRVLGADLRVNSNGGHGWFDSFSITTQGLGNDPYEYAGARAEKKRAYRYEMSWRRNDYFNPGLATGNPAGAHLLDTQYDMQDHDLTLFPESRVKFFAGFSGSSQTGTGLTTVQPEAEGDNPLVVFTNIRRVRREYRFGNEVRIAGLRVNWMRGFEDFKEDTPGAQTTGVSHVEPDHGTSPYWRAALFFDRKGFGLNGRFTHTDGRRAFVVDESLVGTAALGRSFETISQGTARRPVTTGNLNLVVSPGERLTVVNSTSFYSVRMSGNSQLAQFDNASLTFNALNLQYLGIWTFVNETDANFQITSRVGAFAGYEYSERTVRSLQQVGVEGSTFAIPGSQENHLNDGRMGLRLRPINGLTVLVSAEIGRASHPFTPMAERNYNAMNGRVQYRSKAFSIGGGVQSDYRFNSVSLSSYSSQSRKYFADGSWRMKRRFSFEGSFSRAHLYTIGDIAYFVQFQQVNAQSIYASNLNTATAGLHISPGRRLDLHLMYVRSWDSAAAGTQALTYPMAFDSPMARVSWRIAGKLRWNAGYQYYGYRADFDLSRAFRANTGFTSLSWSF